MVAGLEIRGTGRASSSRRMSGRGSSLPRWRASSTTTTFRTREIRDGGVAGDRRPVVRGADDPLPGASTVRPATRSGSAPRSTLRLVLPMVDVRGHRAAGRHRVGGAQGVHAAGFRVPHLDVRVESPAVLAGSVRATAPHPAASPLFQQSTALLEPTGSPLQPTIRRWGRDGGRHSGSQRRKYHPPKRIRTAWTATKTGQPCGVVVPGMFGKLTPTGRFERPTVLLHASK